MPCSPQRSKVFHPRRNSRRSGKRKRFSARRRRGPIEGARDFRLWHVAAASESMRPRQQRVDQIRSGDAPRDVTIRCNPFVRCDNVLASLLDSVAERRHGHVAETVDPLAMQDPVDWWAPIALDEALPDLGIVEGVSAAWSASRTCYERTRSFLRPSPDRRFGWVSADERAVRQQHARWRSVTKHD